MRPAPLLIVLGLLVAAGPGCAALDVVGLGRDPALAAKGDSAETLYQKGQSLFRERRWKDAEEAFGRVWREHKGSPWAADARYYEAECRFAREKWLGAFDLYKSFLRENPLSPHAPAIEKRLYGMGLHLLQSGEGSFFDNSGEGVEVLEQVTVSFPNGDLADDALLLIADHEVRHHRPHDAVERLHDLLDRYPGSEWAYEARLRLARAYRDLNRGSRYDADALRRSAAHYGSYIEIVSADRARAAEYAAQIALARTELREVEEILGRKGLEEADFYLYDGRVEGARTALRNVIRQWPETEAAAEARRRLGEDQ
jgi:outer membrane protein assembly factor BamD (BamD/ComL family)